MSDSLVIIPTYNESANIDDVVRRVMGLPSNFSIIVVDDGSPDGTADIVRALPRLPPRTGRCPDRDFVQALDFPIGVGAVARGRLRKRPLYGSIGLSAGVLVHRAKTEAGLIHRVDPDFRLPIRFAWTGATAGLSVAIIQGWSVRSRSYERRGAAIWSRTPYRIAFVLGLHFDLMAGRAKTRSSSGRRKDESR